MNDTLRIKEAKYPLKWIGAWTHKMEKAGFKVDPITRRLDPSDAVRFVKTVMAPGFMQNSFDPKLITSKQNARVHDEVSSLIKQGLDFTSEAGQRAFDMASSFDLPAMVRNFYKYANLERNFDYEKLIDPEMKLFTGMPCVAVIGAKSFPKFRLNPIDDLKRNIYKAPGFMKGGIETTKEDQYFDKDGKSYIKWAKTGETEEIDQRHAFNRLFAEYGLFGYQSEMEDFDPLTALGGMGMSNHVSNWGNAWPSILTGAKKDWGQLFAEGGYIENNRLNGLTGFQEMIQAVLPGNGILVYAYDYYGGIGRQLLGPEHAKQIEDNMQLILFNRISGEKRLPVNETWTAQAANELFRAVYQKMLDVSWKGEVGPMLQASATGKPIDMKKLSWGYSEHSLERWLACQQYWGNEKEQAFIKAELKKGNAVFPLGEGSNNSTKLYISIRDPLALHILTRDEAIKALNEKGRVTTGRVPFKMLDKGLEIGSGFKAFNDGKNVPADLITIAG